MLITAIPRANKINEIIVVMLHVPRKKKNIGSKPI